MRVSRIVTVSDNEYFYTAGYFNTNKWLDNEHLIAVRSNRKTAGAQKNLKDVNEIIEISLKDGGIRVLCDDLLSFEEYIVFGNYVYYSNGYQLKQIDCYTGENKFICESPFVNKCNEPPALSPFFQQLSITGDGKYIMSCVFTDKKEACMLRIDVASGKYGIILKKHFEMPFWDPGHLMVCPTDTNKFFYCHEGNTFYISNRLWIYDCSTGRDKNIAKQRLGDNGELIDCFGHEMWAPDGRGIYFVKYACSPDKPTGICYADISTGKYKLLYTGHKYWHVSVSRDGRYLASDTQSDDYISEVFIIDTTDGREYRIADAKTDWQHPCHPHPNISPDNDKVVFTALDDNGRTCIKIAYLSFD
ncbi:MAG: hypothetical protein J5662_00260 [Clostridia bacterium]|nr:hypothetical protein [Clostridia bacterium]